MTPKSLRCAIYTRKSSEEGLEQDFNSLHAQREACEAYVLSQAGEGWKALKTAYDDGGVSGGTMERPGLKQLLADVNDGKVDVVVVYKVDRLTRSLTDFARIVEAFDRHGVSFVSVTQAFNTTTSMGRLTLNVLLSFAQFEREVTGERIRDKIAASKKKGLWMGGNLPLGYDASGRTLTINEAEVEQVRYIFKRYLELKSVHVLARELKDAGIVSKRRINKSGVVIGGGSMTRGPLFHLLSNRVYRGQITHKDAVYPGVHPPIVDAELFEAAQALLQSNRRRRTAPSRRRLQAPLTGKLFDEVGEPMSPTTANGRRGRSYRYYVSTSLQKGAVGSEAGELRRLPADALEAWLKSLLDRLHVTGGSKPFEQLMRVEVRRTSAVLTLTPLGPGEANDRFQLVSGVLGEGERAWLGDAGELSIWVPVRLRFRGGSKQVLGAPGRTSRVRPDRALIVALRRAHRLMRRADAAPYLEPSPGAAADTIRSPYERKLVALGYLAPDIQDAILLGLQPVDLTLAKLLSQPLSPDWERQRQAYGFSR